MLLLYINDLARSSLVLKFNLYADDTSVCLSGSKLNTLTKNLKGELSKVNIWFCGNRLTLNSSKSQFVTFHSIQHVIPVNVYNIVRGVGV